MEEFEDQGGGRGALECADGEFRPQQPVVGKGQILHSGSSTRAVRGETPQNPSKSQDV